VNHHSIHPLVDRCNRYGVDVPYFKKELAALSKSLPDRTPKELYRYLIALSKVALPTGGDDDCNHLNTRTVMADQCTMCGKTGQFQGRKSE
jgi:hypothetical protein